MTTPTQPTIIPGTTDGFPEWNWTKGAPQPGDMVRLDGPNGKRFQWAGAIESDGIVVAIVNMGYGKMPYIYPWRLSEDRGR